ncbi:MAG: hypothetical protein FVQ80_06540 [Planctomycetes bacterium]|nr:hypothetical protein [Planctomycetota bacterium]
MPYKKPKVKLVGEDGNAFAILGKVRKALVRAGATPEEVDKYTKEATTGDYEHLLLTTFKYVDAE